MLARRGYDRIAFVASPIPEAKAAEKRLSKRYGNVKPDSADVIVALGGDGLMLQTLRRFMNSGKPIYGMHRGTVGFLMNEFRLDELRERLAASHNTVIHPLLMCAPTRAARHTSITPSTRSRCFARPIRRRSCAILVDGQERLAELVADGVLLSTPAGSTAYNLSAQGPIIPIDAPLMALTPISPFRPRRWHGALLPDRARVAIEVQTTDRRPVAAVADHDEVRDVREVDIHMDHSIAMSILFDPGHSLDERILREQFQY